MGYTRHPIFIDPDDLTEPVWRYIDFTKFVHLLLTSKLHFTRVDTFKDPFEGAASPASLKLVADWYQKIMLEEKHVPEAKWMSPEELIGNFVQAARTWRMRAAASCWHLNNYESAAMWSLYLKSDEGIAIKSTYQRLRDSFRTDQTLFLGLVRYIDYEKEPFIDAGNALSPVIHKRRSFEHEREVRAILYADEKPIPVDGIDAPVDLQTLIDSVIVAPGSAPWLVEVVRGTVERLGYGFPVIRSDLLDAPISTPLDSA